jgi:hypothetical protein
MKSPVQLRVYEKGRQLPEARRPGWVRVELMVRPAKEQQRREFAKVVPGGFWGASGWSKEVGERLMGLDVPRMPAGTVYRRQDDERAEWFLVRQWGKFLERRAGEVGGWEVLGRALGDLVERHRTEEAEGRAFLAGVLKTAA